MDPVGRCCTLGGNGGPVLDLLLLLEGGGGGARPLTGDAELEISALAGFMLKLPSGDLGGTIGDSDISGYDESSCEVYEKLGIGDETDLNLRGTGGGGKGRLFPRESFPMVLLEAELYGALFGDPSLETREFCKVFDMVLPVIWLVKDCKEIMGPSF